MIKAEEDKNQMGSDAGDKGQQLSPIHPNQREAHTVAPKMAFNRNLKQELGQSNVVIIKEQQNESSSIPSESIHSQPVQPFTDSQQNQELTMNQQPIQIKYNQQESKAKPKPNVKMKPLKLPINEQYEQQPFNPGKPMRRDTFGNVVKIKKIDSRNKLNIELEATEQQKYIINQFQYQWVEEPLDSILDETDIQSAPFEIQEQDEKKEEQAVNESSYMLPIDGETQIEDRPSQFDTIQQTQAKSEEKLESKRNQIDKLINNNQDQQRQQNFKLINQPILNSYRSYKDQESETLNQSKDHLISLQQQSSQFVHTARQIKQEEALSIQSFKPNQLTQAREREGDDQSIQQQADLIGFNTQRTYQVGKIAGDDDIKADSIIMVSLKESDESNKEMNQQPIENTERMGKPPLKPTIQNDTFVQLQADQTNNFTLTKIKIKKKKGKKKKMKRANSSTLRDTIIDEQSPDVDETIRQVSPNNQTQNRTRKKIKLRKNKSKPQIKVESPTSAAAGQPQNSENSTVRQQIGLKSPGNLEIISKVSSAQTKQTNKKIIEQDIKLNYEVKQQQFNDEISDILSKEDKLSKIKQTQFSEKSNTVKYQQTKPEYQSQLKVQESERTVLRNDGEQDNNKERIEAANQMNQNYEPSDSNELSGQSYTFPDLNSNKINTQKNQTERSNTIDELMHKLQNDETNEVFHLKEELSGT